ncbi:MAG: oligosaccharide flippase family protein [Lachnospiraceae bacterium]|nr:oligosaccharide flippase family protein [Lachnospiraceae bacterium]
MDKQKSSLGGFLSYFYGNFIVLLLGFIQTPLVTRIMSTEEYGRTGMFEAAVSCIYIFAVLGLDQSYIRYYYRTGIDRRRLMRQCLLPPLILVAALIPVYYFMSTKVNLWLFERTSVDITVIVILYTLVSVFERFLFLNVRMEQNGRLYSNINIAQKLINILLIFLFFMLFGNDFRVVLYAMTLSWSVTTLFLAVRYLFFVKEEAPAEEISIIKEKNIPEKELIAYGLPFILILVMEWILSSCDRIALKTLADYHELGVYSAAMKIIVLLLTFKNTFLAYWSPVAMEKYESGDEDAAAFFRKAFDMVRFLSMMAAAGMILFRNVIVLLLGKNYRGADRIIPFLTLMPIFAIMFEITVQGIRFKKKNIYLNIASLAAIIVNILGNFCLVPILGGTGAAMTTGLSYIMYFIVGSVFSERFYPVGYDRVRTFIDALLLISYAAFASFSGMNVMSSVYGAVLLIVIMLIEKDSVKKAFETVRKLDLKKYLGNKNG